MPFMAQAFHNGLALYSRERVEGKEIGTCIAMSVNYKKMASPEEGQKNGGPCWRGWGPKQA